MFPRRNTVFLSLALAWAEVVGAAAIVIGVNAIDYSGYPDCRPEYLEPSRRWLRSRRAPASKDSRLRILAPLVQDVQGRHHQAWIWPSASTTV